MNREYYIYWYRFDNKDGYLIWFSTAESDGFIVDNEGFIPSFENIENLLLLAENLAIKVEVDEPNFFDLDIVQNWLKNSDEKINDYNPFLNAWNLFDDISNSSNGNFDKNRIFSNNIYEKIFWGCNLPAMTPEGESFTPGWTKKELKIIRETLSFGFQMFGEKVRNQ